MVEAEGARTFRAGAAAYDRFMGRYSTELAAPFADLAGVRPGMQVLDVGCGAGAFTAEAIERVGVERVRALDPSPAMVAACRERWPALEVRQAQAEAIPYEDAQADCAAAELVFHFIADPATAAREMVRVVRPGGVVAACVWDFAEGMEMLRAFWDAALSLDPDAPDEARTLRFGRQGELSDLFAEAGLDQIMETVLTVGSSYTGVDELWAGFLGGIGPAGAYCVALPPDRRAALRTALIQRLGRPSGGFRMQAVARAARGVRR
ncbi:MAG TPA: methyltransferase domain-containing protein [Microlunatus sp.]|nr:methyltransferase domain-containing protein [Microlunatus sp.]